MSPEESRTRGVEREAKSAAPIRSPWGIFIARLLRNRVALSGGAILIVLYTMAIFGSFIGPYDPNLSQVNYPDHPPTEIHFVDEQGNFHFRPFIYETELTDILRREYTQDKSVRYPVEFFVKGEPYKLWWLFKLETRLFGVGEGVPVEGNVETAVVKPPPRLFLFGTDRLGRDTFSRVLSGAKISLSVGLIGIMISMTLGLIVGGVSGYLGGMADTLIMRGVELLMSIPGLYLILALRAALVDSPLMRAVLRVEEGEAVSSGQIYILIVGILGLVSWAGTARVIRGMVLALKKVDYVMAARALGASPWRQITRHLLPNTLTYVIIAATLSVPGYILGEVALSFLGVGIEEPQASWGNMLNEAQNIRALVDFPWLLIPGFFIFITVFAFNFFGDGVRDALDPRYLE